MEKKCSIRFLLFGIILSAAFSLSVGFFAGSHKSWNTYEERIVLLQKQNEDLLAKQELQEAENALSESLKVVDPYQYILLEENGYVAVYHADRETLFASTDILVTDLPEDLQIEINQGKLIENEEQLYNFLENYTS
ncbi:MAG: hypothetical protein HFH42_01895 [Lachnospiraceae bacterium]|jgi:hypothetical protein|nr:hypothetical protein [Lachnospiraceae bacterium]